MADATCSIASCDRPVHVKLRGWCNPHYQRWRRCGDPVYAKPKGSPTCSVAGCELPWNARGMCRAHYSRARTDAKHQLSPGSSVADLPGENWRPILGHEGVYEVSDLGRVRSLPRVIYPSGGRVRRNLGRIMKSTPQAKGHRTVGLKGSPRGAESFLVHRLVLTTFVGPCPPGMEGCHNDGDPSNNRVDNLRWDTSTANHLDMVKHGTHCHASKEACKYGHRLELPNLVKHKLPWRGCRSCAMARSQVDQARRRYGREIDFVTLANEYYDTRLDPDRYPADQWVRSSTRRAA